MRVAIIPARGGSKRIPYKNFRAFHGRPIIAYPIETALASKLFDDVFVSTDDPLIAGVANDYGAQIIERPAELADDHTGTQEVVHHALEALRAAQPLAHAIDEVCCIYPTAALLSAEDLIHGHGVLEGSKACFAFSVVEYPCPPEWALRLDEKGRIQAPPASSTAVRSQDMARAWHDAGYYYWGRASAFLERIPLWGPWSVGVPMSRARAIDINTIEDWHLAEAAYIALMRREGAPW